MRRLIKMLEWVATGVVALVVVMAVLALVGPRFGWNTHPVLSGSMEPALPVGGVIVTVPVRLEDVQVGDIITFDTGQHRITHRVIEIVNQEQGGRQWFRTKGDANEEADGQLVTSSTEFVAKAIAYVPYLGYLASAARNKLTYFVAVGVPTAALVGLLIRDLLHGIEEERGRRKSRLVGGESNTPAD